jgi:hypothetical protein
MTPAKKKQFLARMAAGRAAAAAKKGTSKRAPGFKRGSIRKDKKAIAKASKTAARQWAQEKKAARAAALRPKRKKNADYQQPRTHAEAMKYLDQLEKERRQKFYPDNYAGTGARKRATGKQDRYLAAMQRNPKKANPINRQTQIRITVDRNGREIAYKWSPAAMRYIKTSLDGAKLALATGKARQIKNPEDMGPASAMYESFHGREPARIIEHTENFDYRAQLAELGKLLELRIKITGGDKATLDGFGNCQVACDPDGKNIAFLGGSQAIDLDALEIESDKDLIELGEVTYIAYFAKKGFHNFEPIDYTHHFGEVDGIRPILTYDSFNRKLFLIGGNYSVKPEGITN